MESRVDRSHTLAVYALLLAAALILSYIEALLPPLGIFKLGLANIAVTLGVYIKSRRCGFVIMLCRVFITSLLFGSATTFAFSLLGGLFAWIIAVLLVPLYRKEKITLVGISVLSAAAHNIGQVIAACILLSTTAPVTMLSWLLLASIPAGLLTGITSQIIINRIGDKL
ncbi:MAG: Gx transporter family protein [Clostridia bacterium]|nr:Gx transporter family protein [Clostridia bacterium]